MKSCSICGVAKPLSEYYRVRRANNPNARRAECRPCYRARYAHPAGYKAPYIHRDEVVDRPPPRQWICKGLRADGCFNLDHAVKGRVCKYCGRERRLVRSPNLDQVLRDMRAPEMRYPA